MSFVEFETVCKEFIRQYKSLEPPVKNGIDTLLASVNSATEDEVDVIISTIFSAFYDRKFTN